VSVVLKALFCDEPVDLRDFSREHLTILRRDHERALRHGEHLLTCLVCGGTLHPVRYPWQLDVLAHDPGQGVRCVVARGESARHDSLKRLIAGAAGRVAGWRADVEVVGDGVDPDTGRPPVVDVVATREVPRPFEKPFGWEAQLSPVSDAAVLNRQEVRTIFLARCDWVTPGRPAWRHQVPWLGIGDEPGVVYVTDGIVVKTAEGYESGEAEPLSRVVGDMLRPGPRHLDWVEGLYRSDDTRAIVGGFVRPATLPQRVSARPSVTVVGSVPSKPTVDCKRDPTPVAVAGNGDSQWRRVPNLPNIPQFGESSLGGRLALCDRIHDGNDDERAGARAELVELHSNLAKGESRLSTAVPRGQSPLPS
jgi:hypothetical protein